MRPYPQRPPVRSRWVWVEPEPEPARALPWLLGLNVVVFVAWQLAGILFGEAGIGWMQALFTVSLAHLQAGAVWTLLTSAFSHYGLMHLFFNTYVLWMFGRDVEREVGARGFVHLYVVGGVLASVGHVLFDLVTGSGVPALGASGAVMAVAVVFAALYPKRLLLLFFVVPMTSRMAVGLFVLLDLFGVLSPGGDMIAHAAHLGGAAYGWIYTRWWLRPYVLERRRARGVRRRVKGPWWG